ncbi:MAG: PQQ-binding-like beta-propeller repeat protein [Candidatus Bathyarchaeia archaeon]
MRMRGNILKTLSNKNPQPQRNRRIYAISLILMLTASALLAFSPSVFAHDPPITMPTYPYLAISPNPVGIGQQVFLVMWLHGAPPTASGIAGDRWHDFTITVTKPDGGTQNLGPFVSDPTGSTYTLYTPDQLGTYTFTFKYSGQVLTWINPQNGLASKASELRPGSEAFVGDTFLPSSTTATLTVQQEQIAPVEDYPLPTEYWTRPIEMQNTEWANIASNWLRGGQLGHPNLWQTDGVAPASPHIMWAKPIEFGGIVGGTTAIPSVGFYSGGSYEGRFANSIIMAGKLYYQVPLGHSGGALDRSGGYVCVDLRTGEQLWYSDQIGVESVKTPPGGSSPFSMRAAMKGQLFDYESMNQHGVVGGIIWEVAGSKWIAFDGFTGQWLYNITKVPVGYEVYTTKGEIVRYVLNFNATTRTGWIGLWNNTQDQMGLHLGLGTTTNAYQWRPNGKEVDMSKAYSWNATLPDISGLGAPSIVAVIPGDVILGSSAVWPSVGGVIAKTPYPVTMWALSDKPANRGQLLWIKNYPEPATPITPMLGPIDTESRVFTITNIETMEWEGYSIDTGDKLWGPLTGATRAYTYYGSGRGGGQVGFVAYGNLYSQGFGGEVICYDMKNGAVLWTYNNTNGGLDTPWGLRPIFIAAIADGKVYAFNNEHSPNVPLYKGQKLYCLDATTGRELYTMLGWLGQVGGGGESTAALADGFLTYYNYYDAQVYSVGKGPTAITVEAPLASITKGQSMIIQGKVSDQSAGAKAKVASGEFSTVPAMSDDSMAAWMEYIYMQKPKPTNAKGVEVKLTAIDPNGNSVDIATVTSDSTGSYSCMWTPQTPGKYILTATFAGSNSYWPSSAETAVGVDATFPAGSPAQPSQAPNAGSTAGTELYTIVAAVIVIVAVAAAAVFIMRRRR